MPDETLWVNLHHPGQQAWHRVPNHPDVIQDFQNRGWETPEDSAARAEADAGQLRGKELEDALEAAGLSRGGTVKQKQDRLAEHRAEQVTDPLTESTTTPEGNEGEQV